MLNISLQINKTDIGGKDEARAVVAALVDLYGSEVLPSPAGVKLTLSDGTSVEASSVAALSELARREQGPAPDGYPVQAEPTTPATVAAFVQSAAEAFNDEDEEALAATTAPDRDSDGVPWHKDIHAGNKAQNADGTWRRRRGISDELYNSVMAELKAANTARTVQAAATLAPPPPPPAAEAFAPEGWTATAPAAPPAPPAPPAPAQAAVLNGPAPTFVDIMRTITGLQRDGKLTQPQLLVLLAECGLDALAKLASADESTRVAVSLKLDALK